MESRMRKAKKNFITYMVRQLIVIVCGLVIPRLLIQNFGSEVYGATMSIAQFLSYITLLQAGIGSVVKATLYKLIADDNRDGISGVMGEARHFFRLVAIVFLIYTFILAIFYKSVAHFEALDWLSTFMLVIALSISTLMEYYLGIVNTLFLYANQKNYIVYIIDMTAVVLNAVLVVVLVHLHVGIIGIKLVSSMVFVLKPIAMFLYVQKKYQVTYKRNSTKQYLTQKWSGLSQHIAFFLHSNTDVAMLTLFSNLKNVSVYAVYSLVVSYIKNICTSIVTDNEAVFGDMLARGEQKQLKSSFEQYDLLMSTVAGVFFSTTAVMVIPFVRLYTQNVSDANYIVPVFAFIFILSEYLYCLRIPYHNIIIAAGHFKETQMGAYGETAINIVLSLLLVHKFGLVGVVIGTLVAVVFRFVYYAFYLSRNILMRPKSLFFKRTAVNVFVIFLNGFAGNQILGLLEVSTYVTWIIYAVFAFLAVIITTFGINLMFYRDAFLSIMKKFLSKRR